MRKSANKRPVKIAKTQKGPNILYFVGYGPILYTCDFCGVHACYPLFKDYPQVIYGWGMESALLRFEVQVMVLRNCEDVFNSLYVIREGGGRSDSNVVHVDSDDRSFESVFCDDIFINLIHHCLEGRRGVAEAKKHDCGFKEPIACFERRFVFVALFYAHIVVSPSHIKL